MPIREKLILIDGIKVGILPWPVGTLSGLYRKDLWKLHEEEIKSNFPRDQSRLPYLAEYDVPKPEDDPFITEILLTHAHTDHFSDITYINHNIPIICSEITKSIIVSSDNLSKSNSLFGGIVSYKEQFYINPETGNRARSPPSHDRDFRVVENLEEISCADGSLIVNYLETDHSLPGAGAFFITDTQTQKKIIYTGDIRTHGPNRQKALEFIEHAIKFKPDVLIIEGTRIPKEDETTHRASELRSEEEVKQGILKVLKKVSEQDNEKPVFFECSVRDLWRIASFYFAAETFNRTLVIHPKTFVILHDLKRKGFDFGIDMGNIKVYIPRKGWGIYDDSDYSRSTDLKYIRDNFDDLHTITGFDIKSNPGSYMVFLFSMNYLELLDINPPPNSYFIQSKSEPFDLEGEIDEKKRDNWLDLFDIPNDKDHRFLLHCSGHIAVDELQSMITQVNPKMLFPIHTENSKWFEKTFGDGMEIISDIEYGRKYGI